MFQTNKQPDYTRIIALAPLHAGEPLYSSTEIDVRFEHTKKGFRASVEVLAPKEEPDPWADSDSSGDDKDQRADTDSCRDLNPPRWMEGGKSWKGVFNGVACRMPMKALESLLAEVRREEEMAYSEIVLAMRRVEVDDAERLDGGGVPGH